VKLFIDENLPAQLVRPLSGIFPRDKFQSSTETGTSGWDDVPLIHELGERGFNAIITLDRHQLDNPDEREALRDAGLDWIGIPPELQEWGGDVLGMAGSLIAHGLSLYQQLQVNSPIGVRAPKPSARSSAASMFFKL